MYKEIFLKIIERIEFFIFNSFLKLNWKSKIGIAYMLYPYTKKFEISDLLDFRILMNEKWKGVER